MAEVKLQLRGFGTSASNEDNIVGELDITSSEKFPLSLSFQNFDVKNLKTRGGSFSKTFDIPATNNNNVILRNLWNSGWRSAQGENVLGNIDASVYVDNVHVLAGKVRITKVTKDTEVKSYSCTLFGDNMDWAAGIKNKELKDLKFSSQEYSNYKDLEDGTISAQPFEFNFEDTVSYNVGESSFSGIEGYGFLENFIALVFTRISTITGGDDEFPTNNTAGDFNSYKKNHDKVLYPLMSVGDTIAPNRVVSTLDFIPNLFIKNIWDKIFQSQGYEVVSTFCDSQFFKSLIMPMNFERTGEMLDDKFGEVKKTDGYGQFGNYFYTAGTSQLLRSMGDEDVNGRNGKIAAHNNITARFVFFGGEVEDNYPNNTGSSDGNVRGDFAGGAQNSVVKQANSGTHEVTASIDVRHFRTEGTHGGTFEYVIRAELWRIPNYLDANSEEIYDAIDNDANYNGWQRVDAVQQSFSNVGNHDTTSNFQLSHTTVQSGEETFIACINVHSIDYPQGNGGSVTFGISGGFLKIEGSPTYSAGDPIDDINFLIPKGKQSDFVSGLTQMFNLQYFTDPIQKKVYVEPFDFFYGKREDALNWSDKVDYSKDITEDFIDDLKSTIIFKYKDASNDAFLEKYNKKNYTDYGAYKEINTNGVFQDGEYVIENKYFSPTFSFPEPQYLNPENSNPNSRAEPTIPIIHTEYTNLLTNKEVQRPEKDFSIGARIFLTLPVVSDEVTLDGLPVPTFYHSFHQDGSINYSRAANDDFPTNGNSEKGGTKANFICLDSFQQQLIITNFTTPATATEDVGFVQFSIGTYDGVEHKIDPNLSFNDVKFLHEDVGTHTGNKTLKGLYHNFYAKMFAQLKNNPRVKTIFLKLKHNDILNFDFRNIIYIEGVYYRVNKIVDYKPHTNESTRVELVEHYDLGKASVIGDIMDLTEGLNI